MNERENKLARCETLGTCAWLLMDGMWLMEHDVLMLVFAFFSILFNLLIFKHAEKSFRSFGINAIVLLWVLMNIFWASGDVYEVQILITLAKGMFAFTLFVLPMLLFDFFRDSNASFSFKRFRIPRG